MMVGCGNVGAGVGAILLNLAGTAILKTFPGLGGTDELWYDPTTKAFYVTGNNGTNGTRFFDVITDNGASSTIFQTIGLPTTISAHSITVDPFNGDVFVALAGNLAVNPCPTSLGCIEVFAPTPLPTALPLLATGLGAIGLLAWRRKRKAAAA
jgi:DNA-binding beta-propeller fold protein YncE